MTDDYSETKFLLSLSGDGINLNREIDRDVALQVLNVVLGAGASAPSAGERPTTPLDHTGGPRAISLREYLDEVQPARKPDQIVTIANFICEYEGTEDVSRDEIKAKFSSAREPVPTNFARDFAWAVKNGWLHGVPGKKGRYYITTIGLQAIESRFSSKVKKATTSTKRSSRRR